MATTLQTLTAKQAELQEKLDALRKSKKSTKTVKEQLAEVLAEVERLTAEAAPKKVGRPRTKPEAFYTLRDSFRRAQRGRPSREVVTADLKALGVEFDETATSRELELALRTAREAALAQAAVA